MLHETHNDMPTRKYPPSAVQMVLQLIAAGQTLVDIAERHPELPSRRTWHRWVSDDANLSADYAKAVRAGIEQRFKDKRVSYE